MLGGQRKCWVVFFWIGVGISDIRNYIDMAVTTLRQMRQMPHTEIDDSFKSELKCFCLIEKKI